MIVSFFQTITRPIFGSFEREEYKKFLRLGLIFATILGTYWTIRVLKNVVFFKLVGASFVPFAKTASLITLFPLLIFYNKLLDRYPREKMFNILAIAYGSLFLVVSCLLLITQAAPDVIAARSGLALFATQSIGYSWYVVTETFGSLVVALFWAIASDITKPESAKKGFYFVTALGQIGSIIAPGLLSRLPGLLNLQTDAIVLFIAALFTFSLYFSMTWFFARTPKNLLESFNDGAVNEQEIEKENKPSFFEGLKILFTHKYLLGIFTVISIFEIIATIFDLNFDLLASATHSGAALTAYIGDYATMVNVVAFICLIAGIGNITRFLGVSVALILMPIIIGCALFGFVSLHSLQFLFWLMVGSKAINYALNGPAMKQLYIPTSKDARFKAQSWIEMFGSRSAKGSGSIFNMSLQPLQSRFGEVVGRAKYITFISYIGFVLVACWFVVAIFLGRTYNKAIKEKKIIC
jgi:AAA family ATP:ADP antiporter